VEWDQWIGIGIEEFIMSLEIGRVMWFGSGWLDDKGGSNEGDQYLAT